MELLSGFSNVAILAFLFLIVYVLIKRRRSKQKEKKTIYRKVGGKKEEEECGKVRAVVTGGSGSLGKVLIKNLLQDGGYTVYSMDLIIPDEERLNPEVSAYLQLDILDYEELEIALREIRAEVVFHVAGLVPSVKSRDADLYAVNEKGTKNVVEACKRVGVSRLVYTSSFAVFLSKDSNQVLDLADETTPLPKHPLNAYCGSKMKAEKAVLEANGCGQLLTCALRPSVIIAVDSIMCHSLLTGRGVYIGAGDYKLDAVPVGACARGHILAEKKLREGSKSVAAGHVYHLCGDDTFTQKDFASYTIDKDSRTTVWGYPPPRSCPKCIVFLAAFLNQFFYDLTGWYIHPYLTVGNVKASVQNATLSNNTAHRELGWEKLPSWKQMVEEVVEEYKKMREEKKNK